MNTIGRCAEEVYSPEIQELDQKLFPEPWTARQWEAINWSHHKLFTLRTGRLLGFALFGIVPGDDVAHLYKILLLPEERGTNLGLSFWSDICLELKQWGLTQVYLEVNGDNQRAIRFYEKVGFRLLRRNKSYYSDGGDALIMSLTL